MTIAASKSSGLFIVLYRDLATHQATAQRLINIHSKKFKEPLVKS